MPGLRLFVVAGRAALVISKYELWRFRLVGSGCIRADVSLHDTQDLKAKLSKFLELPRRRVREVLGIHLRTIRTCCWRVDQFSTSSALNL